MEEDLIFGKNRHFFGGIEPSNMLKFSATIQDEHIILTATLPEDTVISGQTLCSVDGAVIRRKTTDYPIDEFDGDLIADIKASTSFTDKEVSANGTYYYAAFPYTTQGVYNRNKKNRCVINEPKPMQSFSVRSGYSHDTNSTFVEIAAQLPERVEGAVIRKSLFEYPQTERDGEYVADIKSSQATIKDSNVEVGVTYYYAAFPYTETGAYNRDRSNCVSIVPVNRNYLFGYDINLAEAEPSARVTYPPDVDNADFAPAGMGFSSGIFNYGGWNFSAGEYFMPRPCMLTYDGTVEQYLDPNDYSLTENGTPSRVSDVSFGGNAMMEWSKIFTKRWEENGIYHFRCTDNPPGTGWHCWSNYDRNGLQIDHFYTPIYFGSIVDDKLRSISGKENAVGNTVEAEIALAKANGDDWHIEVLADRLLIQDLLVMMGRSTNSQKVFGYGRAHQNNNASIKPGTMDNKGMFWGSDITPSKGIKVFGMENVWGNLLRHTAGWIYDNGTQKVKLTRGTYDGSFAADYNLTGEGYLSITNSLIDGQSGGYISHTLTKEYGRIPVEARGTSATNECDNAYFSQSSIRYAACGGAFNNGIDAGLFAVNLAYDVNAANLRLGAALSCKPCKFQIELPAEVGEV